jgi:hypothetical protein
MSEAFPTTTMQRFAIVLSACSPEISKTVPREYHEPVLRRSNSEGRSGSVVIRVSEDAAVGPEAREHLLELRPR